MPNKNQKIEVNLVPHGRRWFLLAGIGAVTSACAPQTSFPVLESGQKRLIDKEIRVIQVTRDNVARLTKDYVMPKAVEDSPPPTVSQYTYRVGVGDGLDIQIWTGPERNSGQGSLVPPRPVVVEETGKFFYPYVGDVQAAGKSVAEIREFLTTQLSEYIALPQVEVSVANFVSQRVTLTGEVDQQGETILTNTPLRLLSLVNAAIPKDEADLSRVSLRRNGKNYSINLVNFIENGKGANPIMLPSDIVTVPRLSGQSVFAFGEIETQEIPIRVGEATLASALALSGGIDKMRADARGIFVFRKTGPLSGGYDVYQVNLTSADAYLIAAQLALLPQDIIYVTNDGITKITDNLEKLLSPITGAARTTYEGRRAVADL